MAITPYFVLLLLGFLFYSTVSYHSCQRPFVLKSNGHYSLLCSRIPILFYGKLPFVSATLCSKE